MLGFVPVEFGSDSANGKYLLHPRFRSSFVHRTTRIYVERIIPLANLQNYCTNIRLENNEKQEFKLEPYAIFNIHRHEFFLQEKLTVRIDITKFTDDDYYLVGSVQSHSPLIVEQLSSIPDFLTTTFGPVRSKVVEYLSCYQPELYKKLSLPSNQWISIPLLNRCYMSPMQDQENESKNKEIERYFNLMGIEDRNAYLRDAKEEKKPLLELLRGDYELFLELRDQENWK